MLQQNPQWLIDYLSTSDIGGKQAIIDNIEQILSHYVFNITPADRMI
jgi:hypothetical protein